EHLDVALARTVERAVDRRVDSAATRVLEVREFLAARRNGRPGAGSVGSEDLRAARAARDDGSRPYVVRRQEEVEVEDFVRGLALEDTHLHRLGTRGRVHHG